MVAMTPEQLKTADPDFLGADLDRRLAAGPVQWDMVRYSLGTVKANIQDDPHNRTRFAVIGTLRTGPSGIDRTSMALAAPHKAGSVYRLLGSLAQNNVSMTRFESRPARNGNWEYYFYVDVEGHIENQAVAKALDELQGNAAFFKVLGSYPVSLN